MDGALPTNFIAAICAVRNERMSMFARFSHSFDDVLGFGANFDLLVRLQYPADLPAYEFVIVCNQIRCRVFLQAAARPENLPGAAAVPSI